MGFPSAPELGLTLNVDAILPAAEMEAIERDDQFWEALDRTNEDLEPQGLYLTHLFADNQIILSGDWLEHLVAIPLDGLCHLQLLRPSTGDLILTKMMRIDPQDRTDIQYLLTQLSASDPPVADLMKRACIPELEEIRHAFEANRAWLLELLANRHALP